MTTLACTACIDLGFQYRFPFFGYALAISCILFGIEAFRPTPNVSPRRCLLIFWAFALATIWFTLCMIPMAWGGFTGVVTGVLALKALFSAQTSKPRRKMAVLALVGLALLAISSAWTSSRLVHHIEWLGRLPTHDAENRRPSQAIRSSGDQAGQLLTQATEHELARQTFPNWIRIGALSREIARLNRPETLGIMTKVRDLALDYSESEDYLPAGLDTTLLACGEASSSHLTDDFTLVADKKLKAKQDYPALILITALGFTDREAAIRWREAHPLSVPDSHSLGALRRTEALDQFWEALQKGSVAPDVIQDQLDSFPPQVH